MLLCKIVLMLGVAIPFSLASVIARAEDSISFEIDVNGQTYRIGDGAIIPINSNEPGRKRDQFDAYRITDADPGRHGAVYSNLPPQKRDQSEWHKIGEADPGNHGPVFSNLPPGKRAVDIAVREDSVLNPRIAWWTSAMCKYIVCMGGCAKGNYLSAQATLAQKMNYCSAQCLAAGIGASATQNVWNDYVAHYDNDWAPENAIENAVNSLRQWKQIP